VARRGLGEQEGQQTHGQVRQKAAVGTNTNTHTQDEREGHGSQSSVRTKYSRAYPRPSLKRAKMVLAPGLGPNGWVLGWARGIRPIKQHPPFPSLTLPY